MPILFLAMSTEYIRQTHLRNIYFGTGLPLQIAHPLGNGEIEAYRKKQRNFTRYFLQVVGGKNYGCHLLLNDLSSKIKQQLSFETLTSAIYCKAKES
jgi:hypothetical protein